VIATRRLAALALALLVLASNAAGRADDEQNALLRFELDWANAVERNDVEAIGRFLHPDFTFTSPKGEIAHRKDHLEDFRNGTARFTLVALSEVEARGYGELAVVTSRPTIDGTVKVGGKVFTLRSQGARWTDSLIHQNRSWVCVARQQSNIPPPATGITTVLDQLLKEKIDGKESKLTVLEIRYAPGASTPPHSHPGPVVVYILDGAIESQTEGSPLTTYRQGDAFFEPAKGKHLISRNASQVMPARFLAFFLSPKEEPLTIPEPHAKRTAAPEYDAHGDLNQPGDFRNWVFVGSNIGLRYRADAAGTTTRERERHSAEKIGDFHNVYINPEAFQHYLRTGRFPEKTVLVMDVYESRAKEPQNIVSGGYFPGSQRRIEVAVKNSERPDGSKTDWAYYVFANPAKPGTAKPFCDTDCYQCHRKHAGDDNVWVQFYPMLRGPKQAPDR
jgi:quercetin dioxygenase-like cupin family protein/ketosteroid isomerase-like protein